MPPAWPVPGRCPRLRKPCVQRRGDKLVEHRGANSQVSLATARSNQGPVVSDELGRSRSAVCTRWHLPFRAVVEKPQSPGACNALLFIIQLLTSSFAIG